MLSEKHDKYCSDFYSGGEWISFPNCGDKLVYID
jgi:hypothetical protein